MQNYNELKKKVKNKKKIVVTRHFDNKDKNESKIKLKNKEGVLSSFKKHWGQKVDSKIAQNKQTRPSNETKPKRQPDKCKSIGKMRNPSHQMGNNQFDS